MHSHTMTKNEPTFGMNSQKISSLLSLPVASPSPSTSPSKNKKKSSSLPPETVEYLKAWMMSPEHIQHPYPTEQEKSTIMEDTSIELKQLTNWFVNNRKRFWKPRVEASLNQSSPVSAKVPKTTKSTDALVKYKRLHSSSISLSSYSSGSASPTISHDNDHSFMEQSVAGTADLMRMTTVFATAPTTVSEHSTLVSDSGSVASHEQDDLSTGEATEEAAITKTESVSVHILRPVGNLMPTLEDVTILANIPAERIIHSYDSCVLNYKLSSDSATLRKKVCVRSSESSPLFGAACRIGHNPNF